MKDRTKVGFISNSFSPYKHAFVSMLSRHYEVKKYYMKEREKNRHWEIEKSSSYSAKFLDSINLAKLFGGTSYYSFNLGNILLNDQLDLLLVGGFSHIAGIHAAIIAKKAGIPVVLITGSWEGEQRHLKGPKRVVKQLLCRLFTGAIAYTEHARAYAVNCLGFCPERVWVGPATVDVSKLEVFGQTFGEKDRAQWRATLFGPEAPRRIFILFAGRFLKSKGGDILLRALSLVPPEFCVIFAGAGEKEAYWRSIADELGLHDRTRWLGHLSAEELAKAYYSSDMLVLPSRSEPHGNVINEAATTGLPIIVSDGVGSDVVVEGVTGLWFHTESVRELASAIVSLRDQEMRHKMGVAGATRMREFFSLECQVDAYKAVIDRILQERSFGAQT